MPKPMIRTGDIKKTESATMLSTTYKPAKSNVNSGMDKFMVDRLLRQKRSKEYMDAISKLDAGGHTHNRKQVEEIIAVIREEFPQVEIEGVLIGYVAACYLGEPYEVHILDTEGGIVEHYKAGRPLPDGMEKARGIAMRGGYAFIEVYVDCCRAISYSGDVSVIRD